jgi:hypothetical protein
LKLPGRLAALARDHPGTYAGKPMASASKAPAQLKPIALDGPLASIGMHT